jgi:hypothetical protein
LLLISSISLGDGAATGGDRGDWDARAGGAGVSPPSSLIPISDIPEGRVNGASRMIS